MEEGDSRQPSRMEKFFGYVGLCVGILANTCVGPMFKYMNQLGVSPCLSSAWRNECILIYVIPLALIERFGRSQPRRVGWWGGKPGLPFPIWVHVLIGGLTWGGFLIFWVTGLRYTTTVRAALFSSLHPVLMVLVLWFKGQSIDVFEWIGIAIGITGVGVSSINPILEEINSPEQNNAGLWALFGDFLCILAAACEVAGILNRIVIRKHVPLFQWIASTTVIVFFISMAFAYLFEGVKTFSYTEGGSWTLCTDNDCLHGWASSFWLGKFMLFSFTVGVIGWSGFTFACAVVTPLVFSAFGLLEPFFVGVLSWTVGLEGVPSAPTIVGGVIIMAGVVFINIGEIRKEYFHRSESSHEKTSALSDGGDALQTLTNGLCGRCGKPHTLMCGIPLSDFNNENFSNSVELFCPMLPTTDFSEFAPFGHVSRRNSMLPEGMAQWIYSEVPDTINEDVMESALEMKSTSAMKDNGAEGGREGGAEGGTEGGSGYQTTV